VRGVNEARVKLWIDALRGGDYKQCRSVLEERTTLMDGTPGAVRHCCLGVAQRVALANGYGKSEDEMDWGAAGMDRGVALHWYGFTAEYGDSDPELGVFPDPTTPGETIDVSCVKANDELGWNFVTIADALEARYITPPNIEGEA
jgi:hypothetical protein